MDALVARIRHRPDTKPLKPHFIQVNGKSKYFPIVKYAFKTILEPIYGDQTSAIDKIQFDLDRNCELMFIGDNPVGILIYKRNLQCEHGLKDALELKTLFLLEPEKNSGKGFGSLLYKRIVEVAKKLRVKTIFCTASEKSKESMNCAQRRGFQIVSTLNKQTNGCKEFLLVKQL